MILRGKIKKGSRGVLCNLEGGGFDSRLGHLPRRSICLGGLSSSSLLIYPGSGCLKIIVGEELHRAGDNKPKEANDFPYPRDVGDHGDLFEGREMLNAYLRVVPNGFSRIAEKVVSQMKEKPDLGVGL